MNFHTDNKGSIMTTYDFDTQLEGFLNGVRGMNERNVRMNHPTLPVPTVSTSSGGRYIRVITDNGSQRFVHCFIDTKDGPTKGNILKAGGWKAPAPNGVRGSIMSEDFGLSCVDSHGCKYLRG